MLRSNTSKVFDQISLHMESCANILPSAVVTDGAAQLLIDVNRFMEGLNVLSNEMQFWFSGVAERLEILAQQHDTGLTLAPIHKGRRKPGMKGLYPSNINSALPIVLSMTEKKSPGSVVESHNIDNTYQLISAVKRDPDIQGF